MDRPDISGFFITPKAFRIYDIVLSTGVADLINELIWLLCHVSTDSELGNSAIVNSNLFIKILDMLESESLVSSILKMNIWLLGNVSKHQETGKCLMVSLY